MRSYLDLCSDCAGPARDALMLAAWPVLLAACGLVEEALLAEAGAAKPNEEPTLAFLAGRLGIEAVPSRRSGFETDFSAKRLSLFTLRRLKCATRWNPWWQVPRAHLWPDGVVLNHSAFLVSEMRARRQRATCYHADQMLLHALDAAGGDTGEDVTEAVRQAADAIAAPIGLTEPVAQRLKTLLAIEARPHLRRAAGHVAALRKYPRLPGKIMTGSGGIDASRAVGMEVRRRGGTVERFDHGGTYGALVLDEVMELQDFAVSTHYTVATPTKAASLAAIVAQRSLTPVAIVPGHGDPHFKAVPRTSPNASGRRRVLYATTILRGWVQRPCPLLSDPVYADWQRAIMSTLAELPVDAYLKPHPSNGKAHPLDGAVPIRREPFESLIAETDIFVIDCVQTTALWAALCSDRPIVLLDLGTSVIEPAFAPALRARCAVAPVRYDQHNEPILDRDWLRDAILSAPERVDASELRAFLAGD